MGSTDRIGRGEEESCLYGSGQESGSSGRKCNNIHPFCLFSSSGRASVGLLLVMMSRAAPHFRDGPGGRKIVPDESSLLQPLPLTSKTSSSTLTAHGFATSTHDIPLSSSPLPVFWLVGWRGWAKGKGPIDHSLLSIF